MPYNYIQEKGEIKRLGEIERGGGDNRAQVIIETYII